MSNLLSKIATLINRIVSVVSTGSMERIRVISEFNDVFKEAYKLGEIERLCSVTVSQGNPKYRHELSSAFSLRSGFKITIHNDSNLRHQEVVEISKYVTDSGPFVRQLCALGFDTLIITGANSIVPVELSLKEISDIYKFMLNNRTND
jgi:hypothetical protein